MAKNPRVLLPQLPPEIRNEIYSYLSNQDSNDSFTTNEGLPFQLKAYECKHTKTMIYPVHSGATSLMALKESRVLEAYEYRTWLLDNALVLRINVNFNGRVNTFVQAEWDRKIGVHLCKLSRRHPWLKKVATYRICIRWGATDGVLKSKRKCRTAGHIPRAMVTTLTQLMDKKVRQDRSDVIVRLILEHQVALESVLSSVRFGLRDFLAPSGKDEDFNKVTIDIWKARCAARVMEPPCLPLLPVVSTPHGAKKASYSEEGLDHRVCAGPGQLVMRKSSCSGKLLHTQVGNVRRGVDIGPDHVLTQLIEECLNSV